MTAQNPPAPQASSRRLLNATAVMAAGTLASRLLGFVKAILLVIVLGATTPQADAYSVATLVPNSLYMLLAGGALNTVLVPQIVRHIKNDADAGEAFINRIVTAFLVVLLGATALAMVFTPQLLGLWTAAKWRAPDMAGHWQQLTFLGLLAMPQLFFYGAFFLIGQVLNARDKFGPMMWAPIVNNVVAIAVLGLYVGIWGTAVDAAVPFTDQQVWVLGLGSTLGIVLQTLALVPAMRAIGFRYRPRFDLKGQGLGETFHLAKWMLGYVLLTTVVQIVVSNLATGATGTASGTGEGGAGITAYNSAYLVWILPHSLLTVSLATAMLPSASRLAAAHDLAGVAAETARTMRLALTFLVPSAVAFGVLGLGFARLAFGHGANADGWPAIGWTLMAFALGLIPYTIQYIHLRGFYALEDTRSVFLLQVAISLLNVALAFVLVALDHNPMTIAPRLALAYSLSYLVGAVLTHRALGRHLPGLSGAALVRHVVQLLVAVLPGALVAALITWLTIDRGFGTVLLGFVGSILVAGLSFFFVAKRLGITETAQLLSVLRRRGGHAPADADAPVTAEEAAEVEDAEVPDGVRAYPHPDAPAAPGAAVETDLEPGTVLARRYRLDEALTRRGTTVTWRGWDQALSRAVLLHVLDPDEPRTLEVLDQARQAASAVDARFLRVWDAVLDEEGEHGSFIVCEYAPGQSLELALQQGAFSDVEAAWVVREVASALAGTHARGLFHRQLSPDTVIVTDTGNVKIVGFLIEHALHPGAPDAEKDPERRDVLALGELLYAATLRRWPGPARHGLRAAPTDAAGRPLLPQRVSTRVSADLSDVVDRILSPQPSGRGTPLTTAADVARALTALLDGADASSALAMRLHPAVRPSSPGAGSPNPGAPVAGAVDATPAPVRRSTFALSEPLTPTEGSTAVDPGHDDVDGESTGALRGRADAMPASPWGSADELEQDTEPWLFDDEDAEDELHTEPFTPIPPPRGLHRDGHRPSASPVEFEVSEQAPSAEPPRRWLRLLVGAFVAVLLAGLIGVGVQQGNRVRTTQNQPGTPYPVTAVRDFDPRADGGDDAENAAQAPFATDGDPATRWTTERYGRSANFNGRKPGAGLVLDLGEPRDVRWVVVNVGSGPTTGEIRVPTASDAATAPMTGRDQWRVVSTFTPSTGEVRLKLAEPVRTRFVLVYLTGLPQEGANHVGAIHEVSVTP